ncbi:MAG: cytochrome c family protein [Alphaproteobacteria bacterium]|nr:cytochrome c family protein [Alphaproteobacteria bacterium]
MRSTIIVSILLAVACLSACGGSESEPVLPDAPAVTASETPAPTLAELPAPYNVADLANGATTFIKCRNCHSLVAGEANKVGPNLHGVFDRPPGTQDKFKYSQALIGFDANRWTPEHIDGWLTKPKDFLPGSSMFFNGIDDPAARRDLIAYLLIQTRG